MSLNEKRKRTISPFSFFMGTMSNKHQKATPEKKIRYVRFIRLPHLVDTRKMLSTQPLICHFLSHLGVTEPWLIANCGIAFLKLYLGLDMDHVWEEGRERASSRVGYNKSGRDGTAQIQDLAITWYAH